MTQDGSGEPGTGGGDQGGRLVPGTAPDPAATATGTAKDRGTKQRKQDADIVDWVSGLGGE